MSGAMLSAPPVPWYCQTPERSRFGAGAEAGFGRGLRRNPARARPDEKKKAAKATRQQIDSDGIGRIRTLASYRWRSHFGCVVFAIV